MRRAWLSDPNHHKGKTTVFNIVPQNVASMILVSASYVLFFLGYFLIIRKSQQTREIGASLGTISAQIGISWICVVGPFTKHADLFYSLDRWWVWLVWVAQTILWVIILIQYLRYDLRSSSRIFRNHFLPVTLFVLVSTTLTMWFFVIFVRDHYVNITWPFAMTMMAFGLLHGVYSRQTVLGLSLGAALCFLVASVLLYSGTVVNGMEKAYPCFSSQCRQGATSIENGVAGAEECAATCWTFAGYGYVYWLYAVGAFMFLWYVCLLYWHNRHPQHSNDEAVAA